MFRHILGPRRTGPTFLAHIQNARQRIAPCVRRTPLTASAALSERLKTNVYVKLELFQKTGSFKVRGAFNKALGLSSEERGQGLVAVSGGNHAQAVAYAARTLGLKSVILMPESTPANCISCHVQHPYSARRWNEFLSEDALQRMKDAIADQIRKLKTQ